MPLSFGSLLGGLTTLIGTPPNIIIANFRAAETGTPFGMFDFTPVGIGVALAGTALHRPRGLAPAAQAPREPRTRSRRAFTSATTSPRRACPRTRPMSATA